MNDFENGKYSFEVSLSIQPEPSKYDGVTSFCETDNFLILSWDGSDPDFFPGEIWIPLNHIDYVIVRSDIS